MRNRKIVKIVFEWFKVFKLNDDISDQILLNKLI